MLAVSALTVTVTTLSASLAASSSVGRLSVAVAMPAAKVTLLWPSSVAASTSPSSDTVTPTVSAAAGLRVRVRVNEAAVPSVTEAASAATVITGRSSSAMVTVTSDGVPTLALSDECVATGKDILRRKVSAPS